jgi:hypothetical protein
VCVFVGMQDGLGDCSLVEREQEKVAVPLTANICIETDTDMRAHWHSESHEMYLAEREVMFSKWRHRSSKGVCSRSSQRTSTSVFSTNDVSLSFVRFNSAKLSATLR